MSTADNPPNFDQETTETETAHSRERRDFLVMAAAAFGAVGAGSVAWSLIDSMNPAKDTLALATTEVSVADLGPGDSKTVTWRGKPVFIRRRTQEEIEAARQTDLAKLPDPQPDGERVKKEELLVVIGICTHLGCVPLGESGDYGGWFCPCHGSHYDTSGRIRKGPAPKNLPVPVYEFLNDTTIRIG